MENITIFTPTFNRAYVLEKAYNSLLKQKNKNFIWMIVDDGSTDDTEQIVNSWKKQDKIKIEYYKIKNGGKANAYNYAIDKTKTDYFLFALDSDDIIVDDGISILNEHINKYNDYNIIAFINDVSNKKNKSYNYDKLNDNSYFEALNEHYIDVETVNLFKTSYLKQYKFPVIEGEKFFTEAYIYYQMTCPVKWTRVILEKATYLNDGLTTNTAKLFVNHPKSWYLYNKLRLEKAKNTKYIIKYTIYLISFGLLSKSKHIISDSKYKLLTIALFPMGVIGKIYLNMKAR